MRMCRRAVTVLALSLPLSAWAAVPVVDDNGGAYPPSGYGTSGAYAGAGASTPASAQGQLFMQLQQMQDQLSRQQGIIEELQNDVSRMKQENLERYQDLDRRINSGAAPAATPTIPPPVVHPMPPPVPQQVPLALLHNNRPPAASPVIRRKKSSTTTPLSTRSSRRTSTRPARRSTPSCASTRTASTPATPSTGWVR